MDKNSRDWETYNCTCNICIVVSLCTKRNMSIVWNYCVSCVVNICSCI